MTTKAIAAAIDTHDGAAAQRLPRVHKQGRLILVTSADNGRLDLVLGAAIRRLALPTATLLKPVVTRQLPAGGGNVVARSTLASLAISGALVLSWQVRGRKLGYTAELMERLQAGSLVIAAAAPEVAEAARALWRDVRVVRLEPGTEALRAGLSPAARLTRSAGATSTEVRLGRMFATASEARVRDLGDLASAVRDLGDAIEMQLPLSLRLARRNAVQATAHVPPGDVVELPRQVAAKRAAQTVRAPRSGRALKPQVRLATPT